MSIDDVHATHLNDKNGMLGSPEVDEDAHTESSEGSRERQQNEAVDSDDEFVDAMEPPSSTSGALLAFEGTPPPLSGVYENALEVTEEQVMAALGSTGSGGRQSTIREKDENEADIETTEPGDATEIAGVEEEVVAVVDMIVETVATAEEVLVKPSTQDVVENTDEEVPAQEKTLNDATDEVDQMNANNVVDADSEVEKSAVIEEHTVNDERAEPEAVSDKQHSVVIEENFIDKDVADIGAHDVEVDGAENENNAAAEVIAQNVPEDEPVVDVDEAISDEIKEIKGLVVEADETAVAFEEVEMVGDEAGEKSEATTQVLPDETEANELANQEIDVAEVVNQLGVLYDAVDANSCLTMDTATELAEPKDEGEVEILEDEVVVDDASGDEQVDPADEITDISAKVVAKVGNANDFHENDEADHVVKERVVVTVAEQNGINASELEEEGVVECVDEAAPVDEGAEPQDMEETCATEESVEEDSHEAPVEDEVEVAEDANENDGTEEATAENVGDIKFIASPTVCSEDEQAHALKSDAGPEEKVAEVSGAVDEVVNDVSVDEEATAHVDKIVAQVTDELVDAVQLEQNETEKADEAFITKNTEEVVKENMEGALEEKATEEEVTNTLEQQSEAVPTGKTEQEVNPVDNNAEDLVVEADTLTAEHDTKATSAAAGSATKEVTASSCSDDHEQIHGIVLGLLPGLGPSSGTTTTTTTIEPFVLSSESNEMMEMHVPPQRWVYEVYGFTIENRVVYYHIHQSDRRTGIRNPPILKRYTDFRELQMQLLGTRHRAAADMPRISRPHIGTVFRGYKSKKTIEIRERAFRALLRYIAQYPVLHGSAIFERFITTSRVMTGAGWM